MVGLATELAILLRETEADPWVVLAGDTRESSPVICRWLAAGLAAAGVRLRYGGVLPTPGVAHLTRSLGASAGVVVSASHNPYPDNGIKLISRDGFKWPEAAESELERRLLRPGRTSRSGAGAAPPAVARVDPELGEAYLLHLLASADAMASDGGPSPSVKRASAPAADRLGGLCIALDTGNGAASPFAGELFERLGARATVLSASPDGRNVNEGCGSTAPEEVARATIALSADLGAAFDGDADRCILADDRGAVRDGDAILYLWATALLGAGRLSPPRIVATSMSNLGLERALARHGIEVVRCGVGDRAVVDAMRRDGIVLGGEQSGHIVQIPLTTTGDGLVTAVQMAVIAHRAGRPLSELLGGFERYPQVLVNVPVAPGARRTEITARPRIAAAARAVEEKLGADGRLLLRFSGTEPLARVMIEGPDEGVIRKMAEELAAVIAADLRRG